MDYTKLKDLIDTEPLNEGRTDQEVLDWLQEDVTVQRDVTYQDLIVWASEEQIAKKTKEGIAAEEATPGTWTASVYNDLLTLDILLKSGGDLALSRSDLRGMINNLCGSGKPYSGPNKAALFAFSNEDIPRWQAELITETVSEYSGVHLGDIQNARTL